MKTQILMPQLSGTDEEGFVANWLLEDGAKVQAAQAVCEIVTSKASFEIEAPSAGYLHIQSRKGARVRAGTVLASIENQIGSKDVLSNASATSSGGPVFSKKAAWMLREGQYDVAAFKDRDFVITRDLQMNFDPSEVAKRAEIRVLSTATAALRSSITVRCSGANALILTKRRGVSPQAIFAHATSQVLAKAPWICARFETPVSTKPSLNYAVDIGTGIRPFICRDFETMSIEDWNVRLAEWSLKIARNEVRPEEVTLGDFTISDLSSLGVDSLEPLLVGSQSAILGIGADLASANPSIALTMAFDHRVHAGRAIAEVLNLIKGELEKA